MAKKREARTHHGADAAGRGEKALGLAPSPHSLEFHPLANIFPLLYDEEFAELILDIRAHGLIEPIVVYNDKILDGRNRYRACNAAGVDPKYTVFNGTHDEAQAFVISANVRRRHLTAKQKREVIEAVLKLAPEKSNRQIAKETETSHHTVAAKRAEMEGRGQIAHVETHTDTKGREQPAHKAPPADDLRQGMKPREFGLQQLKPGPRMEPPPIEGPIEDSTEETTKEPRPKRHTFTSIPKILATIRQIIEQADEFDADALNDFGADLMILANTLQDIGGDA